MPGAAGETVTEILTITDDDTELEPDWLAVILESFDDRVACVGGAIDRTCEPRCCERIAMLSPSPVRRLTYDRAGHSPPRLWQSRSPSALPKVEPAASRFCTDSPGDIIATP